VQNGFNSVGAHPRVRPYVEYVEKMADTRVRPYEDVAKKNTNLVGWCFYNETYAWNNRYDL